MAEALLVRKSGGTDTLLEQSGVYSDSNFIGTRTISKDLGEAKLCRVYVGTFNRNTINIQGSNDNSNWTTLNSASGGDNTTVELKATTSTYRYIRANASGINNGGRNLFFMTVIYV